MSMITGCPACGTLFKVVPDQLKISDGWVRCGHCAEVFDAAANMRQLVDANAAQAAPDASITMTAPLTALAPEPPAPPVPDPSAPAAKSEPTVSVLPSYFPADAIEVREVESPSELDADAEPVPVSQFLRPARQPAPSDSARADLEAPRSTSRDKAADGDDEGPRSIYDPSLDDVTFVRAARRKAFWRRPAVRMLGVAAVLLLAALLAGQVAVQERDRLAAQDPGWRTALQLLCQPVGCRVGPLRRIDAVIIDSSGFTRLRQDAYRLSVTLKNQVPQPVAMPHLELTLTDAQDQPLIRKVLAPREFGTKAETLAPNGDWSASVAIAVRGPADGARVAGYRLLAFYP